MLTKTISAAVVILEYICLLNVVGINEAYEHEGSFLTWQVNNTDPAYLPVNLSSTAIKVILKFTRSWKSFSNPCKSNPSNSCSSASVVPLFLYFGSSNTSQPNYARPISLQVTCQKYDGDNATIIGYSQSVMAFPMNYFYRLRFSGCCWNSNLNDYSSSSYNSETVMHFPKIEKSQNYNSPVQLRYFPRESMTKGETKTIQLPVYDIDGDYISCRWASDFAEGGGIYNSRIGTLNKQACSLTVNSFMYLTGHYAVAIVMEDFNDSTLAVKYHSVVLQFTFTIKGSSPELQLVNCSTINNQNQGLVPVSAGIIPTSAPPPPRPYLNTDGCSNYKTLSHADRSVDHNDWSSYRCDIFLYGWYRFTGDAGDRILSTCPSVVSGLNNSCGSYYKGWLNNQQLPTVGEGTVNRSVCFSPPGSCACSYDRGISIRNCGGFYVYYLDGVPTCNARYCSKKNPTSTVYCSPNYLRIDLDRSRYSTSAYSSITLLQDSCKATLNSTHISLGTTPDSCGTTSRHVSTFIVFENKAVLKAKKTGVISRHSDLFITFSCIFSSHAYIRSGGQNITTEVNATEPGFGQFQLFLRMYLNSQYAQQRSKFPVTVQLNERLYFEASTTARNDFIVLIDRCYSTPVKDSNDPRKFLFVNNRCSVGNNVLFHPTVRSKQRFSILASNLLNSKETAYVNCLVFLCHHNSNETVCNTGCQGNNLKRTARSVQGNKSIFRPSTVSKTYLVQIGAIDKEKDQTGKCQNNPCKNGGTCNLANGKCTCKTGLTGATCETKIAVLDGTITIPSYSFNGQVINRNSSQRIKNDLSNKSSSLFFEISSEIQLELLRKFQAARSSVDNVIITELKVGSLIVQLEVIFKVQINESLQSLEKAFTDAINGSLLGQVTSLRLSDVNECSKGYCSANAVCTNTLSSFQCACKSDYEGNGFTCTKKAKDYRWLAIGLSIGAVCLILLMFLILLMWRRRKQGPNWYVKDQRLEKFASQKDEPMRARIELIKIEPFEKI